MTVSTEVDHNEYTGNGVTTSFPYTFRIFKKSDLVVQVVDLDENLTELILDTDYTVTGAGGYAGGNVVLTAPLSNGYQISISRELPVTQETDLRNQGKFFAEVHEDAFDKLTMLIQQVRSWFSLALRKPSFVANYYDALNNYIRNLKDPRDPQDAATKNYVDTVSSSGFNHTLRVPENYIPPLPGIEQRKNKIVGMNNDGDPIMLLPESGSAADVLLELASSADGKGDALIAVKQPVTGSGPRTQHDYNADRVYITDLGNPVAVSGVASASVDAAAVEMMRAGKAIVLPDGFEWKLSATLMCPQNYVPNVLRITILCPDGRAKMTMSSAGLMLDQNNTDKFQLSYFGNIDFVGFDKQNVSSKWMEAPVGKSTSNFITENCSWDGFHTITAATCISVKHYNPIYYGCGDTGAIVNVPHWSSTTFSNFNLNEWFQPRFVGKFGTLFSVIGGFSNYFHSPWFEKVETVSNQFMVMRQVTDLRFNNVWLENFKTQFFVAFEGDGTEGSQSDIITIKGMHFNNNWSLDSTHEGAPSGFVSLFNRLTPQNVGNNYDTKFIFHDIFEHPNSVQGWSLTRTGSTLNSASSIHEFVNCRLRPGQPNSNDGMTLGGGTPDIRRNFRDLSSNKLDILPMNFQIISGRNTTGSQKDLVFDNQIDTAYFRRSGTKILEWQPAFFTPGVANTTQCGTTTRPWSGGFTQTAFTVTSDEHHKQDVHPVLSDDEEMNAILDAWAEVEFTTFRYIDRVESKGDEARWHFGVIAQRVVEAFDRHGLDWTKYAFICFDKWDNKPAVYNEKTGELMHEAVEAGEKFGIRYEQALVLEAAYMRRELARVNGATK